MGGSGFHFDLDPDPYPTFHFDADPDPPERQGERSSPGSGSAILPLISKDFQNLIMYDPIRMFAKS